MNQNRVRWRRYGSALFLATSLFGGSEFAARADNAADIFGGIIKLIITGAMIDAAKKSWQKVETEVQSCLLNKYGINPSELVQNGITAKDSRVVPYIQSCRQFLEAERQQRAAEEVQRQAAIEAQQRAEEQAREAAQRQVAAEAAQKAAAKEARIKNLKSRFPDAWVQMILDGKIDIGWTREAVREALGEPSQMMRTPDGTEMWAYGARHVIFTDGKVTYIGA